MNTLIQETIQDPLANPHLSDGYMAAINSAATANSSEFKIHNILVPISSLESSKRALECAHWFAEQVGSKISLLVCAGPDGPDPAPRELQQEITKMTGMGFDEFRAVLVCREAPNCPHVTSAAKAEQADLIIMSPEFFQGAHRFFEADPMANLVRHAPCPTLIVSNQRPHSAR